MLEAMFTDLVFTISPKRSTQNLQLSTSCRPITPSLGLGCAKTLSARAWRFATSAALWRTGFIKF